MLMRDPPDVLRYFDSKRKFKEKIKVWNFQKYIPKATMKIIIAKSNKRMVEDDKATRVRVGGMQIEPERLETFKKRKFVKEGSPVSASAGELTIISSPHSRSDDVLQTHPAL